MARLISDERETAAVIDWRLKGGGIEHGAPDHDKYTYRCYQCALESLSTSMIYPDNTDYWQDKQLKWQEECDGIMADFDRRVAIHFPQHQPVNCQSCPMTGILPPKPEPPWERIHRG